MPLSWKIFPPTCSLAEEMDAAARELVYPHHRGCDFFRACNLQLLEEELRSTLQSTVFANSCREISSHEHNLQLGFLGDPSGCNMLENSILSGYGSFEDEDYLFQVQEPLLSSVEDIISGEVVEAAETDSLGTEPLLNEIFNELNNDLLVNSAIQGLVSKIQDIKFQDLQMGETQGTEMEGEPAPEGPLQKCLSTECLVTDAISGWQHTGTDMIASGIDMEVAFTVRRAYSDGDIKVLGSILPQVTSMIYLHPMEPCLLTGDSLKSQERLQKLFRYRKKKSMRNFGRKIKYACRKALADSQPRVRGRFAKIDECETVKHQK